MDHGDSLCVMIDNINRLLISIAVQEGEPSRENIVCNQ